VRQIDWVIHGVENGFDVKKRGQKNQEIMGIKPRAYEDLNLGLVTRSKRLVKFSPDFERFLDSNCSGFVPVSALGF
jgi:hypothetical protein